MAAGGTERQEACGYDEDELLNVGARNDDDPWFGAGPLGMPQGSC
jgi:hypothetical protein